MKKYYIIAAILLALAIPFFVCDGENKDLNEAERAAFPGRYVELTDGVVRYHEFGPENGKPVILVHGGTFPAISWEYNVEALARAGFRVITYDLFGRGLSDRPELKYDRDPWDRQLGELIDSLGLQKPVHLVGMSIGGGIVATYTARHPEDVDRLVMIAPVGLPVEVPGAAKFARLPLIGEYVMALTGDRVIFGRFLKIFENSDAYPEMQKKFRVQMQYRGFKRAVLSMLRHYPMNDLKADFATLAKRSGPILLLWGDADVSNPYANSAGIRELIPGIEFISVPGGTHAVQIEHAGEVNEHLIEFLSR